MKMSILMRTKQQNIKFKTSIKNLRKYDVRPVEGGMRVRILGDLEERLEDVDEDLLEVLDAVVDPVDVEESGNLDQPPDVV